MSGTFKNYNRVYPTHQYALTALLITVWLAAWSTPIPAVSLSIALFIVYLASVYIFKCRIKRKKSEILGSIKTQEQDIIHGVAANTTNDKHEKSDFKNMVSKILDDYFLPENIPFYFIIGLDQSSNKKLLNNAGFNNMDGSDNPGPYTSCADNYYFQWWFTNKGVVIDLSTVVKTNKGNPQGDNLNQIDNLTKFLKQFSSNPVKGLIYTLSTDMILAQEQSDFIKKIQLLKAITQKIVSHASADLQYYLLIQNAQNIEGFSEFVSCYVQTGSSEPIGVEVQNNQIDKYIIDLVNHLNSLMPAMLYDKGNSYNPLLLTKFLNNVDLIRELISELGQSINSISKLLDFKGVYFNGEISTENTNDGTSLPSSGNSELEKHLHNTNSQIFTRILKNFSQQNSSHRGASYSSLAFPVVLTVLGLSEIGYLFMQNYSRINLSKTNSEVTRLINSSTKQINANKLLKILNKSKQTASVSSNASIIDNVHGYLDFSVSRHLKQTNNKLYLGVLGKLMSQNLSNYINHDLSNFKSLPTKQQLEFVRLIVDIKKSEWNNSPAIYSYFKSHIFKNIEFNSQVSAQLENHFNFYVTKINPKNIVIDNSLLQRNILALKGKRLEDYILQSVHAKDQNEPPVSMIDLIDKNIGQYLRHPKQFVVPFRYTRPGYVKFTENLNRVLKLYEKQIQSVSKLGEYTELNTHQLKKKLLGQYVANHIKTWKGLFGTIKFNQFKSRNNAAVVLRLLARKKDITVELKLLAMNNLPQLNNKDIKDFTLFLKRVTDNPKRAPLLKRLAHSFSLTANNLAILKLLREIKLSTRNSWVGKTYLNNTRKQLKFVLQGNRRRELISEWNNTIYAYCVKNFKNRYPFTNNYGSTVSGVRFRKYFGHKGMLDRYYNTRLKKYVMIKNKKLQWNKRGQVLDLGNSFLQQFVLARNIRKQWLRRGRLRLNFRIKPLFLDPRANRFKLTIGGSTIKYSHGVQQYERVRWAPNRYAASVHFTFFKPGGSTVSGTYPRNRWSWVQLIDRTIRRKKGIITFNRKGYKALYRIRQTRSILNKLNLVGRYQCIKP